MDKYNAGVIGATGYAGLELTRLLLNHPNVTVKNISSVSFAGQDLSDIYNSFRSYKKPLPLEKDYKNMLDESDIIFSCLPHGHSQEIGAECINRKKIFIDLAADFRLREEATYEKWYGMGFLDKNLQASAVYGLCEIFRDKIKTAKLIANPGCYPTSVLLGLYPAFKNGFVSNENIVIDSKSGATGAGRTLTKATHFAEKSLSFNGYNFGKHRHTPEIEQYLEEFSGKDVNLTFTTHLLPVNRGILSTIYCKKMENIEKIHNTYKEMYKDEPFVTVLPLGEHADIKNIIMTNSCHISLHEDVHTGTLIICSCIDNMIKGAAGQALQNMNIILGLDETTALPIVAPAF